MVVDDSAFMRLLISDLLSKDKELEVIGSASNGKEAVEKARELKPDVILMDINMDEYDGLYAVEHIMKANPIPIVILSSVGNTNLDVVFDALRLGAVDYINKPQKGGSKIREINVEILAMVKRVARAKPRPTPIESDGLSKLPHTFDSEARFHVIVIGASTGGPSALEKVITSLPANLNVPVLICQHMPPNFILSFADRLDALSSLKVVVGKRGMVPQPGMVIIAPGNANMVVMKDGKGEKVKIGFSKEEYKEYNNPSINALMESVAECYGEKAIGVLLTGMGRDGVKGMKMIRNNGGITIAQDESSSIIYGMPKIAFETGAAEKVMHIKEIGGYLVNCL